MMRVISSTIGAQLPSSVTREGNGTTSYGLHYDASNEREIGISSKKRTMNRCGMALGGGENNPPTSDTDERNKRRYKFG